MQNKDIRKAIEQAGISYWQVADAIGIHPATLCVWLRHELDGEKKKKVENAIEYLIAEKEGAAHE